MDPNRGILVVADGFGGPTAGFQAAKTSCEAVLGFLSKEAGDSEATLPFVLRHYFSLAGNVLFNALVHANRGLIKANKKKSVHEKGGSSVVAAFLDGDLLSLANVGATSAWMMRSGAGVELVTPRTYARMCDVLRSETVAAVDQHVPLMALGIVEDLEPEIVEYRVREGDWVLLQTDGLDALLRDQIRDIQLKGLSPSESIDEIQSLLKEASHEDNLSISLVIL